MTPPRYQLACNDAVAWLRELARRLGRPGHHRPALRVAREAPRHRHDHAAQAQQGVEQRLVRHLPERALPASCSPRSTGCCGATRHFYLFCDQETMFVAKPLAEAAGFKFWKPLIWDKQRIGMGYHYRARYECILFFEKGKRKLNDLGVADIIECAARPRRLPGREAGRGDARCWSSRAASRASWWSTRSWAPARPAWRRLRHGPRLRRQRHLQRGGGRRASGASAQVGGPAGPAPGGARRPARPDARQPSTRHDRQRIPRPDRRLRRWPPSAQAASSCTPRSRWARPSSARTARSTSSSCAPTTSAPWRSSASTRSMPGHHRREDPLRAAGPRGASGSPGCLAYAGDGWSRGILHTLEASPLAAYCLPKRRELARGAGHARARSRARRHLRAVGPDPAPRPAVHSVKATSVAV